jgi:hypothetical protein
VTQTLSRGTTTIWSMSTSVLIDGTTRHVELICDSVELTRDKRDSRAQIDSLLRDHRRDHIAILALNTETAVLARLVALIEDLEASELDPVWHELLEAASETDRASCAQILGASIPVLRALGDPRRRHDRSGGTS